MKSFIGVFIRRPVFAFMCTLALVVFGLTSYSQVGVDLFPNVEFPFVTVTVVYPGADPGSMETKIAKPIEDSLSSIPGIKTMQSINTDGVTLVLIQFDLNVDRDHAAQDVRDHLSAIDAQLPTGITSKTVQKLDTGSFPILSIALSAPETVSPRDLTQFAKDVVKDRIQRIAGVGNVQILGGRERQIHVELDPAKLAARGMTPGDVVQALQGHNLELPAGHIVEGRNELVVTTKGAYDDIDEIANTPIASAPSAADMMAAMSAPSGTMATPVKISDVATVRDDVAEKRTHAAVSGKPAIALIVQKESGANTVEVAEKIKAEIKAMQPELDRIGARITITSDNAPYIEQSFDEVRTDLLLGGLLAVIIVLGFLRDWRATFISALALPTSVIATVWFIHLLGYTFNMMTMLALSLSIGLLIDDAIVVIENIHRHLEMGKSPIKAAAEATGEIGLAVLATTLSIVAVFLPVATMKGMIGKFFLQFGVTVSVAVLVSLFVSFTLTPMLSSKMLRLQHGKKFILSRAIEAVLNGIDHAYRRTLGLVLKNKLTKILTFVFALVVLFMSFGVAAKVKTEFLPSEDRSQLSVDVQLPTGSSLDTTTQVVEAISSDLLKNAPGIDNTFETIGQGQGDISKGSIIINMVKPSKRTFTQQDLMEWARERYASLSDKGIKVSINQVDSSGGNSGFKQQAVQFNLRTNNMDELVKASQDLQKELVASGHFVDVDSSYSGGKPQIEIEPDRKAAAQLGVPTALIAQTLRSLIARDKVTDFKDAKNGSSDLYDINLTVPDAVESNFTSLSNMTVRSMTGALVPLSSVVQVTRGYGPSEIDRQARMRQITVYANLKDITLGESNTMVQAASDKVVPKDVITEVGGMGQLMAESFGYMIAALILAIILVYMILAAQFDSLIHPFTIMVSLPFAFVGAFGGLFIAHQTMSIFSMIGLIMLMGLVTKNAILLVDYANHKKAEGMSTRDALLAAGPVRLRPILMTTAAMVLGMMPVALALGENGGQRAPMAVVVIGGLITSTFLTLIVVPVVYSFFEWLRHAFSRTPKSHDGEPPTAVVVKEVPPFA